LKKWLVPAVVSRYAGAKTVVRTVCGNSKSFEVKVGMHQGSALSPLLFVIVTEAISREFRVALPWELVYADDLAVIGLSSGSRAALAVAGGCRKKNERMGEDSRFQLTRRIARSIGHS